MATFGTQFFILKCYVCHLFMTFVMLKTNKWTESLAIPLGASLYTRVRVYLSSLRLISNQKPTATRGIQPLPLCSDEPCKPGEIEIIIETKLLSGSRMTRRTVQMTREWAKEGYPGRLEVYPGRKAGYPGKQCGIHLCFKPPTNLLLSPVTWICRGILYSVALSCSG